MGYHGAVETRKYSVPAMHCGHCERAVKAELDAVDGVRNVIVALETKLVTVQGAQLDDHALQTAIRDAGYEVADR